MRAGVAQGGGPYAGGTQIDGAYGQIAQLVRPSGAVIYVRVLGR
jgi:hypothetical protein